MHRSRPDCRRPSRTSVAAATAVALCLLACEPDVASGTWPGLVETAAELATLPSTQIDPSELPGGRTRLRFGATPYLGSAATRRAFAPLTAYLAEHLGVPVDLVVEPSYGDLIDAVVAGRVDIVQISPLSYVLARQRLPDLRLLASSLSFGATTYSSFIVVRNDDPAQSIDDLRGRRFAFVDSRSGSGYLLPYDAFLDRGIDPEVDFSSVRLSGSHAGALADLLEGWVDATAITDGTLNNARRGEVVGADDVRVLFVAGRLPYDALCASPALSDSVAKRVAAAFGALNTRTQVGRRVLANAAGLTGWMRGDDRRYDPIGRIAARVRAHRAGHGLSADFDLPVGATATVPSASVPAQPTAATEATAAAGATAAAQ